jgi:predicted RNA binding protein YcfA (HicA-like mRNA interferase family)
MPSLSELPGEIRYSRFIGALMRCGFEVNTSGGKGSHCKVTWPPTQKAVTIKRKITKNILKYLLDEIETVSGVTWNQIKGQL